MNGRGIEPDVVLYMENPPGAETLANITALLGCSICDITRTGESLYSELGLANRVMSEAELVDIVAQNPALLERPIVVSGNRAAVGRPPENVLEIL
jgi:arsenate reductase